MIELGDTARDTITGFKGVAIAEASFLYGCRRICLQPTDLKDGKPLDSIYFDEPQLELVKKAKEPVPTPVRTGGPQRDPVRNSDPGREAHPDTDDFAH